ncbi:NADH-quinone oxidoreductase subunit NuoH [Janibacter sp. DB-40]|uniref:NADH-quinone oxidoreductase subunit NuoH n=1 Tax=Janibacter sp. DB-40 TaxID=3028808 RepID=UPI002406EC9D|nr:NADH-quinone oxidoreductase subunit NuoH [Janibacter sp. DB-40]
MNTLTILTTAAEQPVVADFSDTPVWLSLVKALMLFVYLLISVLLMIWFERRMIGRMQQRPGPNRVGPFGLLQSLADGMKSMLKEDVRPKAADALIFTLAPVLFASAAFISFAIVPIGGEVELFGHTTPLQLTDLPVAALLVLAVAGIAAYGIVLGGWSAGSTYPLLGGLRATAQIISYEIAMGLALVAVFMYAGSMSTSEIVAAQSDLWFIIPACVSFVLYIITMVGETNRLPFDLAEGEGELVGGYFTEYSGMRFAMFFLGEYVNMFTVAGLATTFFLGGWQAPPGIAAIGDGMFNTGWWGVLWFTLKMWLFMWGFVWLRGTLLRTRYDQFMRLGWKFLMPVAVAWVVVVAFIRGADAGFFGDSTISVLGRAFPVSSLIIIGFLAALVFGAMWIWETRAEKKADEIEEANVLPGEVDPFAGGHPVPPLPGQRLVETPRDGTAIETTPARTRQTSAPLAEQEEHNRG